MKKQKSRVMGYTIIFGSELDFRAVERLLDDFLREVSDKSRVDYVKCLRDGEIQDAIMAILK